MGTGESALHFWDPEFCDFEARNVMKYSKKSSKIIKNREKKIDFFNERKNWINFPGSSSNVLGMFSTHLWHVKCSEKREKMMK